MSTLAEQIQKARDRSGGLALAPLAAGSRNKAPVDLASPAQLARRRQFLGDSLGSQAEASKVFERIIQGNDLQDANYLARGVRAARSVARIGIIDAQGRQLGWGTGFLIAPGVLITNNHVLPGPENAQRSVAQFRYELDIDGRDQPPISFGLRPAELFHTSVARDFSVVAVQAASLDGASALAEFGHLPLVAAVGKVAEGEWLTIIQHPGGERKQLCVRENQLIRIDDDVLWYSTDTLGGSSGSPVYNNDWYVVALHHAGVPVVRDGRTQTVDGRDFDPARDDEGSIKWVANEGIRVSRIVEELRQRVGAHPLLQPVFAATPAASRLVLPQGLLLDPVRLQAASGPPPPMRPPPSRLQENPMNDALAASGGESRITVTLGVSADGRVRLLSNASEASAPRQPPPALERVPAFDVPFNADYADRHGFDASFLGDGHLRVLLPRLGDANHSAAAKLLKPAADNDCVLHYHNYSVVVHAARRLALYSAANVDFSGRHDMSRPPDQWRVDPRIKAEAQLTNFYYRNNRFDRGHLTRREDLEFGRSRLAALVSAADTCHWTNCTPQQETFNQKSPYWQGIERYLLEDSIERESFRAQIITGPILSEDDPVWAAFPNVQYPSRFWKVVAAIDAKGRLFATAYILDQTPLIDRFGIEAARDAPFANFGSTTYQVPIAEVERQTGLTFLRGGSQAADPPVPLSGVDPLRGGGPRPRRRSSSVEESAALAAPVGYHRLDALESIIVAPV